MCPCGVGSATALFHTFGGEKLAPVTRPNRNIEGEAFGPADINSIEKAV